jgi:hypothetical protein
MKIWRNSYKLYKAIAIFPMLRVPAFFPSAAWRFASIKNTAELGFYAAFQDGLFLPLFPQLRSAVDKFASDPDWDAIESARQQGFFTARQHARDLMSIFCSTPDQTHKKQVAEKIFKKLVQPLIK